MTNKIKIINIFSLLLLSTLIFSSCEKEPKQGKVFIRINYENLASVRKFTTSNPHVPNNPVYGEYYQTEEGTYNYSWEAENLSGSSYPSSWCESASYNLFTKLDKDRYYTLTINSPNGYCGDLDYFDTEPSSGGGSNSNNNNNISVADCIQKNAQKYLDWMQDPANRNNSCQQIWAQLGAWHAYKCEYDNGKKDLKSTLNATRQNIIDLYNSGDYPNQQSCGSIPPSIN